MQILYESSRRSSRASYPYTDIVDHAVEKLVPKRAVVALLKENGPRLLARKAQLNHTTFTVEKIEKANDGVEKVKLRNEEIDNEVPLT